MRVRNRDKCDPEIFKGATILICAISRERCDELVDDLIEKTQCDIDWFYAAGRNVIKVLSEDYAKASGIINEFLTPEMLSKYELNGRCIITEGLGK